MSGWLGNWSAAPPDDLPAPPLVWEAMVLAALHSREDTGETLSPAELVARLPADPDAAQDALRILESWRVVFRETREGGDVLRVSPHVHWRGSDEARARALSRSPAPIFDAVEKPEREL